MDALMVRPPFENLSESIRVKGHGPAIQDTRALRNSFPAPASSDTDSTAAFHFRSGEHTGAPAQATSPVFKTWKVFTPLPRLTSDLASMEYRTRTFATVTSGPWRCA